MAFLDDDITLFLVSIKLTSLSGLGGAGRSGMVGGALACSCNGDMVRLETPMLQCGATYLCAL